MSHCRANLDPFMHTIEVMRLFKDRRDAGTQLAHELQQFAHPEDVVVLALPRGGVPVAYEVATRLGVPLDVVIVRKLGVPGHSELAMGAIASGGVQILDASLIRQLQVSDAELDIVIDCERAELARRERMFRGDRPADAVA